MAPQRALGEETIEPGEDEIFHKMAAVISEALDHDYPKGTPMRRDAHPKHHGAVRAELSVEPDLPPELRQGLFKTPGTYKAWIRFSNGDNRIRHDRAPDARGMAIKICGVGGEKVLEEERDATTQDFLLIAVQDFFLSKPGPYLDLFEAIKAKRPLAFFFWPFPFRFRLAEFLQVVKTRRVIGNPLAVQYWSTVPFKFGNAAARFSARPVGLTDSPPPKSAGRDFLREAMARHLSEREARFDFLVQLQTDAAAMPIEDPMVHWDEAASPFRKVASIRIPAQTFESPAQMQFAENLSFTPWHALWDHRPLGGINRARRVVYQAISKKRHEANGQPRVEPTGDETF